MPSYNFFDTIEISWTFDSGKGELTVTGTLNGKAMTGSPVVLTHQSNTGTFTGQSGSNSGSVDLGANFGTQKLGMHAQQTDPARNNTHSSDF